MEDPWYETKKRNRRIVLSFMGLFVLTVLFLANANHEEDLSIMTETAVTLSENWTINDGNSIQQGESLPVKLNVVPGNTYEASIILPDVANKMNYLLLRSSMQDMVVYLDGNEIRRIEKPEKSGISSPLASIWVMLKLPPDFQGKTLKLVIKSDVAAFSGLINKVIIGEDSAVLYNLIKQEFGSFVIFLVLFSVGLISIVISIFAKIVTDNRFLYLGLLVTSTSVWILSEAKILQFFTGNRYIIGAISYLMVPLMGLFFCLYVKEAIFTETRHKQLMTIMAGLYLLLLISTILIQALGISEFIVTMSITLMVILLNVIVFSILLFIELVKNKNQNAKQFLKYVSLLAVSVIFEAIAFYTNSFDYTSTFIRIGSLIFFGLLLIDSYFYFKKNLESQKERDLYEMLAYKDILTGGYNRAAFERDFEILRNKEEWFRLVLLDLNELKYINDHYGHRSGDEAIKTLYTIMADIFTSVGMCYRIGGDEFAILMKNTDDAVVERRIQSFREVLKQAEKKLEYPLDVAIGKDVYNAATWSNTTKFYHHVDQQMYVDKLERKQMRKAKIMGTQ